MTCAHKNRVVVSTKPYVERCEGCGMVRAEDGEWKDKRDTRSSVANRAAGKSNRKDRIVTHG